MPARDIHPVVLSGGVGTRLWPLSRALYPKQLLSLVSDHTMLQETALRTNDPDVFEPPLIVCNEEHRFIIAEQLRQIGITPRRIVLEPVGRNTAPAAAIAALMVHEVDPDGLMLVMPADHVIRDLAAFREAIRRGAAAARSRQRLVTFGILPTSPHTGYGYIQRGAAVDGVPDGFEVARFVEKPDQATARTYVDAGDYFWNSGIFLFPVDRYLAELERLEPDLLEACRAALATSESDLSFLRLGAEAFQRSPSTSIDYAVMERTSGAAVLPVEMAWSDVGSWAALWDIAEKDAAGNAVQGDVVAVDVERALLRSEGPAVAAIGLRDVVLVATKDVVLAVARDRAEDVRGVVDRFGEMGRGEHIAHTIVYRPWGSYETMDAGPRFKVKRLVVNPGEKLSNQMHHHRAEHWVVVRGTAKVTRDGETHLLEENQSTYIPVGTPHRLENPGKIPLHIVEVQSGAYLEEDDIVRFEDAYRRR
jgi:mannose-1-phosphate guanylyltransferase/mannose-6-phosphate isomerase